MDLNEHSQCHLQGVIRDIEIGVISYSDRALQVITAGNRIRQKNSRTVRVKAYYSE